MNSFTRHISLASTLLLVAGLALAQTWFITMSHADSGGPGVPDPAFSNIGTFVNLGAMSGGIVEPRVEKTMTIRDVFNNPVVGATITIRFADCTGQDLRLASDQPHHPGQFDCALKTVSAVTAQGGVAVFRIAGGAVSGPDNPAGAGAPGCARVYQNTPEGELLLGNLFVGAYDNNLSSGVNPGDMSNWLGDRNGFVMNPANYRQRSDFDGSGTVTPTDGSLILMVRNTGGSTTSCGPTCL
jgi:hypothetical protein